MNINSKKFLKSIELRYLEICGTHKAVKKRLNDLEEESDRLYLEAKDVLGRNIRDTDILIKLLEKFIKLNEDKHFAQNFDEQLELSEKLFLDMINIKKEE